ncbi:MAG: hypothetical protein HYZ00_11700 [Candidatus Hydrogenedentes bacterium]|nr:hypothetical protein [Candidatus Hydrogenedentota bacterium]
MSNWMPLPPGGTGVVDAAIAQVIPGAVDPLGSILEIGTISSTTVPAFLNQAVKKSGRTSGLTRGSVVGLDATISVSYSDECAGNSFVTTFNGQILVSPGRFLKGGDSGSLMVEDVASTPRAVGLLYAGSTRIAVAAPIDDALNAFGVTLVGAPSASASSTEATGSTSETAVQRAARAKAAHAAELASIPGAVGHAVGLGGGNAAVIQVLVEAITPEARQAKPATADGVPVVLMEVGKVVAY